MSIQIHYIKNHPYAYDHNRVGDKVVCTYIGRRFDIPSLSNKSKRVTQHKVLKYSNKIDKKLINEIEDMYKKMPGSQKKLINEIEIIEEHKDNIMGHAEGNKIFLYEKSLKPYDYQTKKQTIYHETAHLILYDNYHKKGTVDFFKFIDAVEKEGSHSKYANKKKNTSVYETEAFCDIHGDISSNPKFKNEFKKKYPDSYREYKNIITDYI